jgi:hypothetical protein
MSNQKNIVLLLIIFVVAGATRFLPINDWLSVVSNHPIPNFTAIGAIAFMGGALIKNKWLRFVLPLSLLFVTDIIMNAFIYPEYSTGLFYDGMLWVYIPFVLSIVLGRVILKEQSPGKVVFAGFVSGIVFFLLSNFGVWMSGTMYPKTGAGLMEAYYMGLPFFRNTLMGNMVYGLLIYFAFTLASKRITKQATA